MASNIAVKITADVASLQSQLAIARVEFQQTQRAMNDLAKQAASTGLNDKLKADLQQASANMLQAKQRTADLAKEMKDLQPAAGGLHAAFEMLTHVAGAFGVALSIEKLVEFGRAIIENAAAIQHQADVLGLSVIGYQAFIESAKSAGAATESIDVALRRFNNSQGAAQAETGAQAEAFRKLGVNAFIPAEQALPAVAKALLNIQNTSERARLEMILFGRSGQEVNVALAQWARGTVDLNRELSAQGLIIDPKTTEAMHKLEVQGTLTWDKIKVAAAGALVQQAETMKFMASSFSFGAKFGGQLTGVKPPAELAEHKEEAKKQEKSNPELDQALAIAGAIDVSDKRVNLLTSDIKLMKAELKDPAATVEMKKNLTSAISVAEQEIKTLTTKKAFAGTGFSNAGDKAIAEARVTISEINADQTRGDAERRAAIDQTYAQLLNSAKLNAAQIATVEIDKNKAIAAANKQAATEKRQIDQTTAQTEQRIAQIGFDAKRSGIEEEVTAGNLSRQQGFAELQTLTDEETAARLRAVQQAQQGYAADTTFFIQKELEKKVIVAESEAQKAAIRRQAEQASASESAQIWRRSMSQIEGFENTFGSQLLSGRVGVLGALQAAGAQFAQAELQQTIRGVTQRLLLNKSELAADHSLGQLGLLTHWLFEGQKTAATAAGEGTRTAVKQAASTSENAGFLVRVGRWIASELGMTTATTAAETARAGAATASAAAQAGAQGAAKAAEVAINVTAAESYAAVAATGAAASQAFIPIVGPELAIAAAAATFGAMQPFVAMASLDVGTNMVPRDMPAMIHAGERVVPKADNQAMIAALNSGGANGNGGPVQFHYHPPADRQGDHRSDAKEMIRIFNHARRTGALK